MTDVVPMADTDNPARTLDWCNNGTCCPDNRIYHLPDCARRAAHVAEKSAKSRAVQSSVRSVKAVWWQRRRWYVAFFSADGHASIVLGPYTSERNAQYLEKEMFRFLKAVTELQGVVK